MKRIALALLVISTPAMSGIYFPDNLPLFEKVHICGLVGQLASVVKEGHIEGLTLEELRNAGIPIDHIALGAYADEYSTAEGYANDQVAKCLGEA